MLMDNNENHYQGLSEENCKITSVLHSNGLPKFDFDCTHTRFDSLVGNEGFLGIYSREDDHWIEEFSPGNRGIEFSSSATESCSIPRGVDIWSEATSSESVEMLLKSVGEEEMLPGESVIEESVSCDELGTLAKQMELNSRQGGNRNDQDQNKDLQLVQPPSDNSFLLNQSGNIDSNSKRASLTQIEHTEFGGSVVNFGSSLVLSEWNSQAERGFDDCNLPKSGTSPDKSLSYSMDGNPVLETQETSDFSSQYIIKDAEFSNGQDSSRDKPLENASTEAANNASVCRIHADIHSSIGEFPISVDSYIETTHKFEELSSVPEKEESFMPINVNSQSLHHVIEHCQDSKGSSLLESFQIKHSAEKYEKSPRGSEGDLRVGKRSFESSEVEIHGVDVDRELPKDSPLPVLHIESSTQLEESSTRSHSQAGKCASTTSTEGNTPGVEPELAKLITEGEVSFVDNLPIPTDVARSVQAVDEHNELGNLVTEEQINADNLPILADALQSTRSIAEPTIESLNESNDAAEIHEDTDVSSTSPGTVVTVEGAGNADNCERPKASPSPMSHIESSPKMEGSSTRSHSQTGKGASTTSTEDDTPGVEPELAKLISEGEVSFVDNLPILTDVARSVQAVDEHNELGNLVTEDQIYADNLPILADALQSTRSVEHTIESPNESNAAAEIHEDTDLSSTSPGAVVTVEGGVNADNCERPKDSPSPMSHIESSTKMGESFTWCHFQADKGASATPSEDNLLGAEPELGKLITKDEVNFVDNLPILPDVSGSVQAVAKHNELHHLVTEGQISYADNIPILVDALESAQCVSEHTIENRSERNDSTEINKDTDLSSDSPGTVVPVEGADSGKFNLLNQDTVNAKTCGQPPDSPLPMLHMVSSTKLEESFMGSHSQVDKGQSTTSSEDNVAGAKSELGKFIAEDEVNSVNNLPNLADVSGSVQTIAELEELPHLVPEGQTYADNLPIMVDDLQSVQSVADYTIENQNERNDATEVHKVSDLFSVSPGTAVTVEGAGSGKCNVLNHDAVNTDNCEQPKDSPVSSLRIKSSTKLEKSSSRSHVGKGASGTTSVDNIPGMELELGKLISEDEVNFVENLPVLADVSRSVQADRSELDNLATEGQVSDADNLRIPVSALQSAHSVAERKIENQNGRNDATEIYTDAALSSVSPGTVVRGEGGCNLAEADKCSRTSSVHSCSKLSEPDGSMKEGYICSAAGHVSNSTCKADEMSLKPNINRAGDGLREEKSFSFDVPPVEGRHDGESDINWQSFQSVKACKMAEKESGSTASDSQKDHKDGKEVSQVTILVTEAESASAGAKSISQSKTRRSSTKSSKESANKGNTVVQTEGNRSCALVSPSGPGRLLQFDVGITQSSGTKIAATPIPTSNLPDLNTSTSTHLRQPFSDQQQIQLRSQIFVYGSLIQGAAPEEACMVSAFGTSDGGRTVWEPKWRACVERLRSQPISICTTPVHLRSASKPQNKSSKQHTPQSKVVPSPTTLFGTKDTPVKSMIPLSSPLWNLSTPSRDGVPFSNVVRGGVPKDFHALHPCQTPPPRAFGGQSTSSSSPAPVPGPRVSSSSTAFDCGTHLSSSPSTETVKLTPLNSDFLPTSTSISNTPIPHGGGSSNLGQGSCMGMLTSSSAQNSAATKSRKRKKSNTTMESPQNSLSTTLEGSSVPYTVAGHPPEGPAGICLGSISSHASAPIIGSHFSTSVVASASSVDLIQKSFSTSVVASASSVDLIQKSSILASSTSMQSPSNTPISHDVGSSNLGQGSSMEMLNSSSAQNSAASKSRKRKKSDTTGEYSQNSLSSTFTGSSVPHPATSDPSKEGPAGLCFGSLSSHATAPVIDSHFSTPVAVSASSVVAVDPIQKEELPLEKSSDHKDDLKNVEEAKLAAKEAVAHAADVVNRCESIWSVMLEQRNSRLDPDTEAQLSSAAAALAAAASVAKAGAAAAKLASSAALHFHQLAVQTLTGNGGPAQNGASTVSDAGEAAGSKVEASMAASEQAGNLDAILKAAELAAEAVSQAGRVVSMGKPLPLSTLVEAGPENYWRDAKLVKCSAEKGDKREIFESSKEICKQSEGHSDLEMHNVVEGRSLSKDSARDVEKNIRLGEEDLSVSHISSDKGVRGTEDNPSTDNTEAVSIVSDRALEENVPVQNAHGKAAKTSKDGSLMENCAVEVFKDGGSFKGAWYSAKVLGLDKQKALVCYTDLQVTGESDSLREWVPVEGDKEEAPIIRVARPMSGVHLEGTRKRCRSALTEYHWAVGDRVDAWIGDCWREGDITEQNKNDPTIFTVQFPGDGVTSLVKAWDIRPTFTWKNGQWVELLTSRQSAPSQGDTPREKRMRLGSPIQPKGKGDVPKNINNLESGKVDESNLLPLSSTEKLFDVGTNRGEKRAIAPRMMRSGLQKEGSKIFGVPRPGTTKKFMDVSKHYVSEGSNKNVVPSSSSNIPKFMMPKGTGSRRFKNTSEVDLKTRQGVESKLEIPKASRLPGISSRTFPQKENSTPSTSGSRETISRRHAGKEPISNVEKGSWPSLIRSGPGSDVPATTPNPSSDRNKKVSKNSNSKQLIKGKLDVASARMKRSGSEDKQIPDSTGPRRSNRKIQPTSRLLEGLQSSFITSKIPSVSHRVQARGASKRYE